MESNQNQPEGFYAEVDRSRYRSNWSCLVFLLLIVIAALATAWWFFGYAR